MLYLIKSNNSELNNLKVQFDIYFYEIDDIDHYLSYMNKLAS
jgi:hypothetical protein